MPDHPDQSDPPRAARGGPYDLVVIGSGPAGEKGAAQAAYFGKKVALIERQDLLGGSCANTGTLPSKTLRESALYLSGLRQRDIFGVDVTVRTHGLKVSDFMVQKNVVCQREVERIKRNLERHHIEVIRGTARLLGPGAQRGAASEASLQRRHTVRVTAPDGQVRDLQADFVLLTPGSSPRRPPGIPFDDPDVDDSDEVLSLDSIPASFIVVGGGVIGCEYASIFAALGTTKVTLVEARERLLGFLDDEIGERLSQGFTRLGMELIFNDTVALYEKRDPNGRGVRVTLKGGRVIEADRLLAAAGRVGNTRGLGLEDLGVKLDERGLIVVDRHYQTSVPGIYAAGDVIGWPSLASTSMEQGRVAMCHAFQLAYKTKVADVFPYGLYTIPEVSMVGATEAEARKKGDPNDVEVGRSFYKDNARGQIINDPEGMVKLVFEAKTKKLLGVHILGERATELIHIGQAVLTFGGTIDYFIDNVFNYPTLSEIYKYAAYDGLGRLAKRPGPLAEGQGGSQ